MFHIRNQLLFSLRGRLNSRYYDASANCSTTAADTRDACADCPTSIINVNAACLNPSQHSGSYKVIASAADQPRGDKTAYSTGGSCTSAANTSESIGYFKPVEFAAINLIGWSVDRRSSTCRKHAKFFWSKSVNDTKFTTKNLRRTASKNSS
jgi:hypothetical protein